MVPEVGLEPTRRLDPRGILSPVRLPIPPLRHQWGVASPTSVFYAIAFPLHGDARSRQRPYHTVKRIQCQGELKRVAQELYLPGKLTCSSSSAGKAGQPTFPYQTAS
jgi:hypothetical protein